MNANQDNLERAIEQAINLGQKDPVEIVKHIRDLHGEEWWAAQLVLYGDDFVAEMARQRINAERRGAISVLSSRTLQTREQSEVMLKSVWIPSADGFTVYKRVADVTAPEWRSRADYLDRLAIGVLKQARWCRDVADRMDESGAATTADLRSPLPELPSVSDLELPALEAAR